jgi:hypothetical protein
VTADLCGNDFGSSKVRFVRPEDVMLTMSQRPLLSRSLVAAFGAAVLTLGPAAVLPAHADPVVIEVHPGQQADAPNGKKSPQDESDKKSEKAEKMGGGLASKMVDLGAGLIKCGISMATESVPCKL